MSKIDVLFKNCKVYSMNNPSETYKWIAVKDGIIIECGEDESYEEYVRLATEVVDLDGKCIIPGFYDCHVHLVQTGINLEYGVELSGAKCIDDVLERIVKHSNKTSDSRLIRGIHFDINGIKEKRYPTRKELDYAAPKNPVFINSMEYHTSIVNSAALTAINLPYNIEGIARDERNLPAGLLQGKASAFVRNKIFSKIDDSVRRKGVFSALHNAACNGVTTIHAMEGGYTFHKKDAEFVLENNRSFTLDVLLYYQSFDINTALKNKLPRIGGDLFLDGSFDSRTAALLEDYSDMSGNRGKLYYNDNELINFIYQANENNIQTAFHAIGTRAIEQILNVHEKTSNKIKGQNLRHRIEHFELADNSQIQKAIDLNLILSVQPAYEYYWGSSDKLYEIRLGKKRASMTNRFKCLSENGLILCGGSDSDVTEINPLLGIYAAVNHPKKESSVSVFEAVKMFTKNGAYSCFEEEKKGSLSKGKIADMVVLDEDIFQVDNSKIKDICVYMTIKEGNIIYTREDVQ